MTHVCFNPSEAYIVIWRRRGSHKYYWITPSSIERLSALLANWKRNDRVGGEFFLSEVQSD